MALYGITAVRLDLEERVTHVQWGRIGAPHNTWATPPAEATVDQVIDALVAGDEVVTIFPSMEGTVPGPRVCVVVYENGMESIDLEPPGDLLGQTLQDLPTF